METPDLDARLRRPIGQVLRAWRMAREWTLTELAERATQERVRMESEARPISRGYLSEVERNRIRTPGIEILEPVARALGIPVSYLVTRQFPTEGLSPRAVQKPDDGSASPLFARYGFDFPDLTDEDEERLFDQLHELLSAPELHPQRRAEVLHLLRSFTSWLRLTYLGKE